MLYLNTEEKTYSSKVLSIWTCSEQWDAMKSEEAYKILIFVDDQSKSIITMYLCYLLHRTQEFKQRRKMRKPSI